MHALSQNKKKNIWEQLLRKISKCLQKKPSMTLGISALVFGGLTLLFYSYSLKQLPDFTWNDLTGTLFAVCITGFLVVVLFVAYCLCAGFLARLPLEAFYPVAGEADSQEQAGELSPADPHSKFSSASFLFPVTCFSFLLWIWFFASVSTEKLVSPYDTQFRIALYSALVFIVILILPDWTRSKKLWIRDTAICLVVGSIAILAVVLTAWSIAPDTLVSRTPAKQPVGDVPTNWAQFFLFAIGYAPYVGLSATFAVGVIFVRRSIFCAAIGAVRYVTRKIYTRWPNLHVNVLARLNRLKLVNTNDLKLMMTKICVTACFCFFAGLVILFADLLASMGSSYDRNLNFIFIITILTVLNWLSFSMRKWRERTALGLLTAAMLFVFYPVFLRNPSTFPKMVVSMLGLGNEHLASIGVSSKQCATLAPYGVSCASDNERSITLTSVNLLNRLGGTLVLELLVKANVASKDVATKRPSTPIDAENETNTLFIDEKKISNGLSPIPCDDLLLSRLQPGDPISSKALRCVVLVIPKDQVAGYTKASARTYRGDYSAFQSGPAKAAMNVNLLRGPSQLSY